jgi:hypothetical protein
VRGWEVINNHDIRRIRHKSTIERVKSSEHWLTYKSVLCATEKKKPLRCYIFHWVNLEVGCAPPCSGDQRVGIDRGPAASARGQASELRRKSHFKIDVSEINEIQINEQMKSK